MRRKALISRLTTLVLSTLGCLLLGLLVPLFLARHATDEPFLGYSVMASPRDMHIITATTRLSSAPDLTLNRGALYADGNAVVGTPISRFVLDGAVFNLNASGLKVEANGQGPQAAALAPLFEPLIARNFDTLIVRRGTLHVTSADGDWETLSDVQAELSGWRKGQIAVHGSFMLRGQRLAIDATITAPGEGHPQQWGMKLALKGDLLEVAFDGQVSAAEDLQVAGQAELVSVSLRRLARWFGLPIPAADGLNATSVKGQMHWAHHSVAIENAKVALDGNEANGALVLNMTGERPLIDGTLAFGTLDLGPYVEAARSQTFVFDRQTASWSAFDLAFPIIKHVDADLRISAPRLLLKNLHLGRGAATITVRSGKLLADVAELELNAGSASGQITADTTGLVPHYAVRGKIDNLDAGAVSAALFGPTVLSGRATLFADLAGTGQTPAELLRDLCGKATLSLPDGGKLFLDLAALQAAARDGLPAGWAALTKAQLPVEPFEARATVDNGVIIPDAAGVRGGGFGLAAAGRIDMVARTLDLQLLVKPLGSNEGVSSAAAEPAIAVRGPWAAPAVRSEDAPLP